jgi:homoserine dehydrogenase
MTKRINIVLFGIGNTGSALINKVVRERKELVLDRKLDLRFPVIANSTVAFFEKEGANYSWEANFIQFAIPFKLEDVLYYLMENNIENLIAVDATASVALAAEYQDLIKSGFSIVTINESLNSLPNVGKGLQFLAESRGLEFRHVRGAIKGKEAAADALFDAILDVAEKKSKAA